MAGLCVYIAALHSVIHLASQGWTPKWRWVEEGGVSEWSEVQRNLSEEKRGEGESEKLRERERERESFPSFQCLCFFNNTEWRYAEYKHRNWRAVRMPVVDGVVPFVTVFPTLASVLKLSRMPLKKSWFIDSRVVTVWDFHGMIIVSEKSRFHGIKQSKQFFFWLNKCLEACAY